MQGVLKCGPPLLPRGAIADAAEPSIERPPTIDPIANRSGSHSRAAVTIANARRPPWPAA